MKLPNLLIMVIIGGASAVFLAWIERIVTPKETRA